MSDLIILEREFCERIEFGPGNQPYRWRPLVSPIPPDVDTIYLRLLVQGSPGSYWVNVEVVTEAHDLNVATILNFPALYLQMPTAGRAGIVIDLPFRALAPGHYILRLVVAGKILDTVDLVL